MKLAEIDFGWTKQVKEGQIKQAYEIYRREIYSELRIFALKIASKAFYQRLFSSLILKILKSSDIDTSETAVDLNHVFLFFWKHSQLVGPLLFYRIALFYLKKKRAPIRAIIWYSHWLNFQGDYRMSVLLFRSLKTKEIGATSLKIELDSFYANYLYVRGHYRRARVFFRSSHIKAKDSKDNFRSLINLGMWIQIPFNTGSLQDLDETVQLFDGLSLSEPDPRYGLRLLCVTAYLRIKYGQTQIGYRFWHSAEKVFETSNSSLDRSIYYITKALILALHGGIDEALRALALSGSELGEFGEYKYYEDAIKLIKAKFLAKPLPISEHMQILTRHPGLGKIFDSEQPRNSESSTSANWFQDFFDLALPMFQNPDDAELSTLIHMFREQFCAKNLNFQTENPTDHKYFKIDLNLNTSDIEFNMIHREVYYRFKISTPFLPWRNKDFYLTMVAMLRNLQAVSFSKIYERRRASREKEQELINMAKMVAHDIRSPVGTLQLIAGRIAGLSLDEKNLLNLAVSRIQGIANELLEMGRGSSLKNSVALEGQDRHKGVSMSKIVSDAILLKEIELEKRPEISLIKDLDSTLNSAQCLIDKNQFMSIVSNLLNNSIEAIDGTGKIFISTRKINQNATILIRDTGRGIPDEMLPKLMSEGATFGKSEGNGLGLFQAKVAIENCGGLITIQSKIDFGTSISISLPISEFQH